MNTQGAPSVAVAGMGARTPFRAPADALGHPFLLFFYYLAILSIPYFRWRQLDLGGQALKLDWLFILILLAIAVPYVIMQRQVPPSLRSNLWGYMAFFFAVNLFSSLLSPYPEGARAGLVMLVLDGMFIAINLVMINRLGFTRLLPLALVLGVSVNAFFAILGYFFKVERYMDGTRGIGGTIDANNAAIMGVYVLPLAFYWLINAKSRTVAFWSLVVLGVNVLGIVSSESRAGFLNMCLVFGILLYQQRHKFHPRYIGPVVALASMVVLAAIFVTPEEYIARIRTITEGTEADASTMRRSAYIEVGLESFTNSERNMVIGTGTLTFRQVWFDSIASRRFKEWTERAAHNTYLEVLVGTGLLGLAAFFMLLVKCARNYNLAVKTALEGGQKDIAGWCNAYRVAFYGVLVYLFFKSGLDHKMFMLAIPLSQIALDVARQAVREGGDAETGAAPAA